MQNDTPSQGPRCVQHAGGSSLSYLPPQGEVFALQGISLGVDRFSPSATGPLELGYRNGREGHREEAAGAERRFLESRLPGADGGSQSLKGWPEWLQAPWVHPEMGVDGGLSL